MKMGLFLGVIRARLVRSDWLVGSVREIYKEERIMISRLR
jgi:hypothetical protein